MTEESMKRTFAAWVAALLLATVFSVISAPSVANDAQPAADPAAVVEQHYAALADLTAKVVQKNRLVTIGKTQTFEGTLRIRKPGRLRIDYTNGQQIVIDGSAAWFYSKKSEQAFKRTFTDFEQANIPVAFLLGASSIRDDFAVTPSGAGSSLDLTPKKPGASMKKLILNVDQAGRITAMTIHDKSGNRTEITFSDIQEDTGLGDDLFKFTPPKGTEIIQQ
jgi:outer membrane lipoprotein carrier protein